VTSRARPLLKCAASAGKCPPSRFVFGAASSMHPRFAGGNFWYRSQLLSVGPQFDALSLAVGASSWLGACAGLRF
jgi:hypothetical protein